MTIELPLEKREKILCLVKDFEKMRYCKIRDFARFVGILTAACPAIAYGWVYQKLFERQKFLALLLNNINFDSIMYLPELLRDDFLWWKNNIMLLSNPIRLESYSKIIYSDASLSGWGAMCEGRSARGFWNSKERREHINYLELAAAFFALKCFAGEMSECEILLKIDNSTAIAYVNKMGGTRFPKLNSIARDIWQWCEKRKIWLRASYIPSKENVIADRESRVQNIDTEWELNPEAYNLIIAKFGTPTIDLFASRVNKKCTVYFSRDRDPEALDIDAFTRQWTNYYFYAFPPFSVILKMLKKIISDQASGIVVVPDWPSQPWYPLWESLRISDVIIFKPTHDLLLSPCRQLQHPLAPKLTMVAAVLSYEQWKERRFQGKH